MHFRSSATERLFFIYMPGCETCASLKPLMQRFRRENPSVEVIALDITAIAWEAEKWAPQVTPTLVRLSRQPLGYERGKPVHFRVYDGRPAPDGNGRIINEEEMRAWLQQNYSWQSP